MTKDKTTADIIEAMARTIAYTQMMRQYVDLERLNDIGCVIEIDRVWPQFVSEAVAVLIELGETPDDNVIYIDRARA